MIRQLRDSTVTYPRKASMLADGKGLSESLADCVALLTGGLSLGSLVDGERAGHLEGQALTFEITTAKPKLVPHGLGRRPKGRVVLSQDAAGVLYDVRSLWTSAQAAFLSSRIPCAFTVWLL